MKLVIQRRRDDCGVACAAMLAGVSYARAEAAFLALHREARAALGLTPSEPRSFRSTTRQVSLLVERLGGRPLDGRRLRPISAWWRVPSPSLVRVDAPDWHWVVLFNGSVHDPHWRHTVPTFKYPLPPRSSIPQVGARILRCG